MGERSAVHTETGSSVHKETGSFAHTETRSFAHTHTHTDTSGNHIENMHFSCSLQHFGAGNCHFHGICNSFEFEPFIPWYLQHFGGGNHHFPRYFETN